MDTKFLKNEKYEKSSFSLNLKESELRNYLLERFPKDKRGQISLDDMIGLVSEEMPELLLRVAEENWLRGYDQALSDHAGVVSLIDK